MWEYLWFVAGLATGVLITRTVAKHYFGEQLAERDWVIRTVKLDLENLRNQMRGG